MGIEIDSVPGRGYRIQGGCDLLDAEKIRTQLPEKIQSQVGNIEVLTTVDSTNRYLLEKSTNKSTSKFNFVPPVQQSQAKFQLCLAEQQTDGRGRRGKTWQSPFAANINLSCLWEFDSTISQINGLSLVIAVVVSRVLKKVGLPNVSLKWPNDILINNKKIGGILVEMTGDAAGPCKVVIGIGINVNMPSTTAIDTPWTDLHKQGQSKISRNELSAALIHELIEAIATFQQQGLMSYLNEWRQHDAYQDKSISLENGAGPDHLIYGIAKGVNDHGELLVAVDGNIRSFNSGEVSLRLN